MKRYSNVRWVLGVCTIAVTAASSSAHAQCNTCATPVVAFSPVVAPATTVTTFEPVSGWYPGKLIDTWRMRRWGFTAPTTVTTAFAPTWSTAVPVTAAMPITTAMPVTANFVPQTVNFAPMTTTTFATPHVTAFAPLGQRQVFMQPTVVASPVVTTSFVSSGCSSCSACEVAAPCSSCAASTVVEQATFAAPAAAPCSSCAQGSSITYASPAPAAAPAAGQTPQPQLTPQEAAPLRSNYPDVTPPVSTPDPGPATQPSDSSTYFEPPALFIPGDRTASAETAKPINRAPSVNVWNAVYRQPVEVDNVSTDGASLRSQAEIDAVGWSSVPAN